jgi:hypothetical protein
MSYEQYYKDFMAMPRQQLSEQELQNFNMLMFMYNTHGIEYLAFAKTRGSRYEALIDVALKKGLLNNQQAIESRRFVDILIGKLPSSSSGKGLGKTVKNSWLMALQQWNKGKAKYSIPKKGSKAYNEVKALMK